MGELLKKVEGMLAGRKTYLGAALLALSVFALQAGWIDQPTYTKLQTLLIAWGFAALRASK